MESMNFHPLSGFVPHGAGFQSIIAPPYDVLTREEARDLMVGKPFNILRVTRADANRPPASYPYADSVYRLAHQSVNELMRSCYFRPFGPGYIVYQIGHKGRVQTGLMAFCSNDTGFIKTHEKTRREKLRDRIKLHEHIDWQVSPVLMMHRHSPELASWQKQVIQRPPNLDAVTPDGSRHRAWFVSEHAFGLASHLRKLKMLYMADGHHRLAANRAIPDETFILGAFFSEEALQVLPYHRVLKLEVSLETFKNVLAKDYEIKSVDKAPSLGSLHELGVYFDNKWHHLTEKDPAYRFPLDKVPSLRAERGVIRPFLQGADLANHPAIGYIGGFDAVDTIEQTVQKGVFNVGLTLPPISLETIREISDRNEIMPPKSTWFEPKLADGIILSR